MDASTDFFSNSLTRRRLVQLGAGAGVALYLGGFERLSAAAAASGAPAPLRRSSYTLLAERGFQVDVDGIPQLLQLVGAEDLPVAATVPTLQGLDDAFVLTFLGDRDGTFAQGTREMFHPTLGRFSLFLAPVDQPSDAQRYEAVIDRTVRIPGLDDDGAPAPVNPAVRQGITIRNRRRKHKHRHRYQSR